MKRIILTITAFLCLIMTNQFLKADEKAKTQSVAVSDTALNETNVYLALLLNNIKFPEVVYSQIMLESGNLTSRLTKKNNNILGMTVASKRETTALNKESNGYAKYSNWLDCILDYKLYQDYVFSKTHIKNASQYIAYLHRNYANSPSYKAKLTKMVKQRNELRNSLNFIQYNRS